VSNNTTALLIGYYGQCNTGDDAFLAVSAWAARRLGHGAVMANIEAALEVCGYAVQPLYQASWLRALKKWRTLARVRGASRVIFGGGSNFHTTCNMEEWTRWLDRAGAGPHLAAGVSIGPFRDAGAEAACARLLSRLAFVGVRDAASLERAQALHIDTPVELTFDIAPLLLQMTDLPPVHERRGLGIAICHYERYTQGDQAVEARRMAQLAAALTRVAQAGLLDEVVLIDFNGHPVYGDTPVHRELADLLGTAVPVRHVPYHPDPRAVLRTIAGLRGLLAMRLHASMFAYLTNTPAVQIAYHEKCHEWARTIGAAPTLSHDSRTVSADALADALTLMLSPHYPVPTLPVSEALARAGKNFQV